jgi:hypothetical protein
MSPMSYTVNTADNGQVFITAFIDGVLTTPIDNSHPNFADIQYGLINGMASADILDLFDIPATIERKFQRLSERVTVEHGQIKFDGDVCQPALSTQILRFMDEGHDFEPLVRFMENIQANPQDDSREQAYAWLNNHAFSITDDGDVVAYKGVSSDGNGGYCSGFSGTAMVNDTLYSNRRIPNAVGDVVTMPRSAVAHDPHAACHTGLHVGTFDYAKGYANGAMLRVIVDPRDIVSVPHDASGQKIRVCRYVVDAIIEQEDTGSLYGATTLATQMGDIKVGERVIADGNPGVVREGLDDDGDYYVEYDDSYYGAEYVGASYVIREVAAAPIKIGDAVVCTEADYGIGAVTQIDEDGDVWVKWPDIRYTCCMASDEVAAA